METSPKGKTGYISELEIKDAFKHLGVALNERQHMFLIMALFAVNQDLNKLPFKEMFKIFKSDPNSK